MSHPEKATDSRVSAYERGLAHLKRAEHAEAVAAFSEAIGLEPGSPNAYVGRGLAYRSLGDDAAAQRDEEAARGLGGPEGGAWDRLVNRANRRWRGDLRDSAWRQTDPLSCDAVLLRHWSWQIYNGGVPQWVANGYAEWAEELAQAAEKVGTPAARAVAAVVRDVVAILRQWPDARDTIFRMVTTGSELTAREDQLFGALLQCEEPYHRVGPAFGEDVEAWLERQAGNSS